MNLKLFIALFALLLVSVHSEVTCENCKCAKVTVPELTKGESIPLCVHFISTTTGSIYEQKRAAFSLKVDEFADLELKNGQEKFAISEAAKQYEKVYVMLQTYSNVASPIIPYVQFHEKEIDYYTNVFSAVITIHDGVVKSITWDNRCANCDSANCVGTKLDETQTDYTCNQKNQCNTKKEKCDPKFYITWIGSDKQKTKMTSTETRLARFENFNLDAVYVSAESPVAKTKETPTPTPTPTPE